MSNIYAGITNQYKFKNQTVFSTRFDQQDDHDQKLDENDLFINLKINQKLTQSDIHNIHIRSHLESQIQNQERKDSGWQNWLNHKVLP